MISRAAMWPCISAGVLTASLLTFSMGGQSHRASMDRLAAADSCTHCDFIVSQGGIVDGDRLGVKPGEVICLQSGRVYDRLTFRNIHGTKQDPVIIRNCGGVARVYSKDAFGVKFERSRFFKFVGDGTDDQYGIRISTEKGFYLTMENFTTDFEIARIEIAGPDPRGIGDHAGFAGIGVKTSPYVDCDLFSDPTRKAWIMRNVTIHHNYIHDTGGEGMYIGHGFYTGRKEKNCSKVTYSHSIKALRVYSNLIEHVGNDGIQIKNADSDVDVYSNVIKDYGTHNVGAQNEGLFIGEGTTGNFFSNIVDGGTGNGCQIQGLGDLHVSENAFLNSGENGIYVGDGEYAVRWPNGFFDISNNTIYNSKLTGLVFFGNDGGLKRFTNNLVVGASNLNNTGDRVEKVNNIFSNDPKMIGMLKSNHYCLGRIGLTDSTTLKKVRQLVDKGPLLPDSGERE